MSDKEFPKGGVTLTPIKGGEPVLPPKYKLKPIIHKGFATFEVEEIPPKHDYQEKIYPVHPSTKQQP